MKFHEKNPWKSHEQTSMKSNEFQLCSAAIGTMRRCGEAGMVCFSQTRLAVAVDMFNIPGYHWYNG